MTRILAILILSFGTISLCTGQTENDSTESKMRYGVHLGRHISILTGFNFWRNFYGELGVAINQYGRVGHHPAAWAYFVSNEIKIDNKILIGPKIGV
jgi:hypothetical protein